MEGTKGRKGRNRSSPMREKQGCNPITKQQWIPHAGAEMGLRTPIVTQKSTAWKSDIECAASPVVALVHVASVPNLVQRKVGPQCNHSVLVVVDGVHKGGPSVSLSNTPCMQGTW